VKPKVNDLKAWSSPVQSVEWNELGAESEGEAVETSGAHVKSVQVFGEFGDEAAVTFEGSNDGAHWAQLRNVYGNFIEMGDGRIESVNELTRFVRPKVLRGDKRTKLYVVIFLKRESK
jgi:hypothetical protein